MHEASVNKTAELPNIVSLIAERIKGTSLAAHLITWENLIFSLAIVALIALLARSASRKPSLIPGRLQSFFEMFVSGIDDFVCGIIGPKGREYVPFIGTLFIYILCMNLIGIVPLMKSPSTSWS
ncbi:MAG: F0F1 ATP synthase subunit A, partial [Candidatus Omnitrophica bacterium]|nr:F0F1 ATP synthase subunit A [Candidatus Omnitrophota bacterium]